MLPFAIVQDLAEPVLICARAWRQLGFDDEALIANNGRMQAVDLQVLPPHVSHSGLFCLRDVT